MVIYGVAILASCYFVGMIMGNIVGRLVGLNSNVGGVGFAMLLLLLVCNYCEIFKNEKCRQAVAGITFWQNMYIPVVIAMAATQNVIQALKSGTFAILCGIVVTIVCLMFIPIINHFLSSKNTKTGDIHD